MDAKKVNKKAFRDVCVKYPVVNGIYTGVVSLVHRLWHSELFSGRHPLTLAYLLKERSVNEQLLHLCDDLGVVAELDPVSVWGVEAWAIQQLGKPGYGIDHDSAPIAKAGILEFLRNAYRFSAYCVGWVAFEFRNPMDPVCIKLRKPFSKDVLTLSSYPMGRMGVFPASLVSQKILPFLQAEAQCFVTEGEFNSLSIMSSSMNTGHVQHAAISFGSSLNTDFDAAESLFHGRPPIIIPDNDLKSKEQLVDSCPYSSWKVLEPSQYAATI